MICAQSPSSASSCPSMSSAIPLPTVFALPTLTRTGERRVRAARSFTAVVKVAEKSMVWRPREQCFRTFTHLSIVHTDAYIIQLKRTSAG